MKSGILSKKSPPGDFHGLHFLDETMGFGQISLDFLTRDKGPRAFELGPTNGMRRRQCCAVYVIVAA